MYFEMVMPSTSCVSEMSTSRFMLLPQIVTSIPSPSVRPTVLSLLDLANGPSWLMSMWRGLRGFSSGPKSDVGPQITVWHWLIRSRTS